MPKPAQGPHLTYRPGLDGLRALAVIAVFLYHAWPQGDGGPYSWASGGYLGVDLFFVLSGYLITSILLIEWERDNRINLLRFWGRRARRLFPALVVVVFAALLLSAIFARADLSRTRSDTLSSLFYYNNWHEIVASNSYFVRMGNPSLLSHIWSLAVEEQFYLLWPLVLVPGLIFLGRKRLPYAVIGGIIGSAGLMWLLYDPNADATRVYEGTDTRAFLLLMGILLALVWPYIERIRRGLPLLELLGVVALGTTIYLFATVPDPSFNPTYYQGEDLAAAFCFAVLIAAVAHPASRLDKALGVAPLRWIGERSYGMYLWHYPVVELTRPGVDLSWSGPGAVIGQATIVVVASALSYRFIEQPIRTGRAQKWLATFGARRELLAAGAVGVVAAFVLLSVTPSATSAQTSTGGGKHHHHGGGKHHHHGGGKHHHGGGHHHKKPYLPPGRMLAVGDSVMKGCSTGASDYLRPALDHRVLVNAAESRQIKDTIAVFQHYRAKHQIPNIVIVQVGNNGPPYLADRAKLKHVLRDVPDVIVVNVRNATPWENQSNGAITEWLHGWHEAHLADWYHHSNNSMLQDGTHPYPAGCRIYAQVIRTAVHKSMT